MTHRKFAYASLIAGLVLFSLPAPASASGACKGHACRGKDPVTMGCNRDARTIATAGGAGFRVELRYSRRCDARWARTTYVDRLDFPFWIYAQLGSGAVTRQEGPAPVQWSLMWSGRIRACGGAPGGESPFPAETTVCTRVR